MITKAIRVYLDLDDAKEYDRAYDYALAKYQTCKLLRKRVRKRVLNHAEYMQEWLSESREMPPDCRSFWIHEEIRYS